MGKNLQPSHLSSFDHFDTYLQVASRKNWIIFFSILFLMLCFILWGIFGSIPIEIQGRGVLVNPKGFISIQANTSGYIRNLKLKPGDFILKGDSIAEIYDPLEEIKKLKAETKEERINDDLARLSQQIIAENKKRILGLERNKESKEYSIERMTEELPGLEKELASVKKLYKEGLVSASQLRNIEEKLTAKKIAIENSKAEISGIEADLAKEYRVEELKNKEQLWLDAKRESDLAQAKRNFDLLRSPANGRVLEVKAKERDQVKIGQPIIWLEVPKSKDENNLIYGYAPIEKGKKIELGNDVNIEVSSINTQEFGYIRGKVTAVSHYSVSESQIAADLQNEDLAKFLINNMGAVIHVVVEPERDPKTFSGFAWTSGEGPQIKIATGTVCLLKVVVDRVRPITYLVPLWRFKSLQHSTEK